MSFALYASQNLSAYRRTLKAPEITSAELAYMLRRAAPSIRAIAVAGRDSG